MYEVNDSIRCHFCSIAFIYYYVYHLLLYYILFLTVFLNIFNCRETKDAEEERGNECEESSLEQSNEVKAIGSPESKLPSSRGRANGNGRCKSIFKKNITGHERKKN